MKIVENVDKIGKVRTISNPDATGASFEFDKADDTIMEIPNELPSGATHYQ